MMPPLNAVPAVPLPLVGNATPPSYLQSRGFLLLACAGVWILLVSTAVLIYYFLHQPQLPAIAGQSSEQIREALSIHKEIHEQWMESLTSVFDMLVTKTVLPIATLLLGYLFGKRET